VDSTFALREDMLSKTNRLGNAPPVTTTLRWRSPGDTADLEAIDQQAYEATHAASMSSSIVSDENFDLGLEQSSISYLDDVAGSLASLSIDAGGAAGHGADKKKKKKTSPPLDVYGTNRRMKIEAERALKAARLAAMKHPKPIGLPEERTIDFTMPDAFIGENLRSPRVGEDDEDYGGKKKKKRRKALTPVGVEEPVVVRRGQQPPPPPPPLKPLFEDVPVPDEPKVNMQKLFSS
jgi:hypothetical protein